MNGFKLHTAQLFSMVLLGYIVVFGYPDIMESWKKRPLSQSNNETVRLITQNTSAFVGDTICLEVQVVGFEQIASFQTSLQFNPSLLQYISGTADENLPNVAFGQADNGAIPISWVDFTGLTVSLPDSSVLFTLCFLVTTSEAATDSIAFGDDPLATVFSRFDGNVVEVPVVSTGGRVDLNLCDPTVILNNTTRLSRESCNLSEVGIDTVFLTDQLGCDSLIITNTTLLESDTTIVNLESCDPSAVGVDTSLLSNQLGCDSLVITSIVLSNDPACTLGVETSKSDESCAGFGDGQIQVVISSGEGPFRVLLEYPNGRNEIEVLTDLDDPLLFTNLLNGAYQLRVTDRRGQGDTTNFLIEAGEVPLLTYSAPEIACGQAETFLTITASEGISPYLYSIDGGRGFVADNIINNIKPGTYQLMVEDLNGCRSEITSIQIDRANHGEFLVLGEEEIALGDTTQLSIQSDRTLTSINWFAYDSLVCTGCDNLNVTPTFPTIYTIQATDNRACEYLTQIEVFVDRSKTLFLPNIFSPNGDGINDYMKPLYGNNVNRIVKEQIFDRWGNSVYQGNGSSEGWDGIFRGELAPPDMYLWVVEVLFKDGRQVSFTQEVSLIR